MAGAGEPCVMNRHALLILLAVIFPLPIIAAEPEAADLLSKRDTVNPSVSEDRSITKRVDTNKTDFVLTEVRKTLEPNPETEVVELAIDPDYSSDENRFLVNVVIDVHGNKLMIGVMVALHPVANGWEASMGYVD